MAGIFVSYRRSDSGGHTGRLTADLIEGFEPQQLFRDLEAIEAGTDFAQAIERAVNSCSVMLAVIGPQWLTAATPDGKRRLDLEHDFVRVEIATALARNLRVIPVLVGNASMPTADQLPDALKSLAGRQAHEISDRRWDYDVDQLFTTLAKVPGVSRRKPRAAQQTASAQTAAPPPPAKRGMSLGMKALIGGVGVLVVLMGLGALTGDQPEEPALDTAPAPVADAPPAPLPAATQQATVAAPPPAATARTEPGPQPVVADSPATTPPAGAAVNLTGVWQNDEGDQLYFEQNGQEVAVAAADGSGTHGFMGQGIVRGQRVELTLVHLQSGGTLAMQMTVAPDGRRMSGIARENTTGTMHNITFARE